MAPGGRRQGAAPGGSNSPTSLRPGVDDHAAEDGRTDRMDTGLEGGGNAEAGPSSATRPMEPFPDYIAFICWQLCTATRKKMLCCAHRPRLSDAGRPNHSRLCACPSAILPNRF